MYWRLVIALEERRYSSGLDGVAILELLGVSPVLRPSALHPPRQFQRARVIEMTLSVVRSGEEMQGREEELLVRGEGIIGRGGWNDIYVLCLIDNTMYVS
jgi:hypothetical protein